MAQRFGGKFSPDGTPVEDEAPRRQVTTTRTAGKARVNLLYLAPLPLLWTAFRQDAIGMALDLGAAAVLALGVYLLSEGLKAEAAFDARKVAKRPAVPRKIFAAALCGLGVFMAAFSLDGGGTVQPLIYGIIAVVLHVVAFGFDPLKSKGVTDVDDFQNERVAKAVDAAEGYLDGMIASIKQTGDRRLEWRVEEFANVAREMFRQVEQDPRDLTAARKFLGVYLEGARDATVKFVDHYGKTKDATARLEYATLLQDLETNFSRRTEKLMESDRTDLDVEIEVLRDRLAREGVHMNRS